MNSHKETERFYLSRFKELCPEFPDGNIEDFEGPDFLVHGSHGIVGIELTAVYRPGPIVKKNKAFSLQAIEKERDKIVDRIKGFYLAQGGSFLRVSLHFSGNATDKNDIQDKDLEAFAALIKENQPRIGDTVYFPDCLQSQEDFPFWLEHVSITMRDQDEGNFWTASTSAKRQTLSSRDIQKVIEKKDGTLSSYKKEISCVWLVLLTFVDKGLGTHVNFSKDVWTKIYETSFDEVWIFQNLNSAKKLEVIKHYSNTRHTLSPDS